MIDLRRQDGLPDYIKVGNRKLPVQTDFRYWITYDSLKQAGKFNAGDTAFLLKGVYPNTRDEWIETIAKFDEFFANPNLTPRNTGESSKENPVDFVEDGEFIYASFYAVYGIDLVDIEYLHWFKFLAMFRSLPEESYMKKIMGFRLYKKTSAKHETLMQRAKEAWKLPVKQNSANSQLRQQINNEFYNC